MVTRATRLLPLACVAGAIVLFASELMTTFEFTPPGGEAICEQSASDRHGNALALIAAFAIGATAIAVLAGSKPAALAVAVAGGVALLLFLVADLPDAGAIGTIDDSCGAVGESFFDAEAVPQAGFWIEMLGALSLALSGIALATLTPDQLAALRPGRRAPGPGERAGAEPTERAAGPFNAEQHEAAREVTEEQAHRPTRRSRPRQRR